MNKHLKILFPTLLAVAIVFGMLLGKNLQKRIQPGYNHVSTPLFQPDKLSLFIRLIEKDYVDSIDKNQLIEEVIPQILEKLDPHTNYIPASDMQGVTEEMRGNFSGIGVKFVLQNDTVMIVEVVTGGPSQALGIMAGDRIVKVNGEVIAGMGMKNDQVVSMLRGKKGTMVQVSIQRPGFEEMLEFDIKRGDIPLFSVDVAYMIAPEIGLIKINRFAETTHREFVNGIQELEGKGATKLIVDLRGNSGGYLQEVFQMVDEFLPAKQLIVYTQGKARSRYDYYATEQGIWEDKEVLVLIDEFSASASEIFAGAIQDNDRGLVVGRRSFGKGLVQEQIPFYDGSALRLTVARFYTPSGRSIQKSYENGLEAYSMDYHNRIIHNELSEEDSIQFNDSLKYQTLGGRTVYGGGGIMPDFFVPVDTTGFNDFFAAVVRKNLVYYYAFDYADKHRKTLNQYDDVWKIKAHLNNQQVFEQFLSHVRKNDIAYQQSELQQTRHILKAQLYAYICRNILGDYGFYPIIFEIDDAVKKSVELLQKGKWSTSEIVKLETRPQH
ncbi:MAG: PDZ domain-containing protein [Prolixibacteraceae bacterium]|nr:PDZ domain-containing protein [Prolixibacteraceae bacterium]